VACPITTQAKGYPFEVAVDDGRVAGVILADQLRNIDWKARKAARIGKCKPDVLEDVLARIAPLLGFS
jgi:mRNA interferase MazF